jgi:transglutaminase-like putative cysteine protease
VKRLQIVHRTTFHYADHVVASYNEARMLPAHDVGQFVLSAHLDVSPGGTQSDYVDYWGTRVVAFEAITPHRRLDLTASSLVETEARDVPSTFTQWDELERIAGSSVGFVEQSRQTPRTRPARDVVELARDAVSRAEGPDAAATAICRRIGETMRYVPGSTGVHTTAADAWATGSGVCQDIVHVAVGALRAVGVPARYVSGYLHPDPAAVMGMPVTGESHAWIEWFAGGWRGYDPTNLIDIGDRHVLIGRGRDYDDVAPFRGVYAGSGASEQTVSVEITRVG